MREGAREESYLGTVTQPHNPVSTDSSPYASGVCLNAVSTPRQC